MNSILLITFISAFISWILIRSLLPYFQKFLICNPNNRSSHKKPIPSGGGIVIALVYIVFNFIFYIFGFTNDNLYVVLSCFLLSIVGLIDDKYNLKSSLRFSLQIFVSFLIINFTNLYFQDLNIFLSILLGIFLIILSCTVINFTNFMDGLDGLVGGCMFIIFFTYGYSQDNNLAIWSLIGAILGFILWNWSPSKIFMGDSGSTFLGAVFISLVYESNSFEEAFGLLLVATPILFDSFFCLIRRFLNGQNIFRPHKLHLYQRLHQKGLSHSKVSFIYILGCMIMSLTFLIFGLKSAILMVIFELFIGYFLDKKVAVEFK